MSSSNFDLSRLQAAPLFGLPSIGNSSKSSPGHTLSTIGKYLLVLGPVRSSGNNTRILVVDYYHNTWEFQKMEKRRNEKTPPVAYFHASFVYDESIYVVGGLRNLANEFWRFDVVMMEWVLVHARGEKIPLLAGHSCEYLERRNEVVMFGGAKLENALMGAGERSTNDDYSDEVYVLDMSRLRWTKPWVKGRKPPNRYCHASCTVEDRVYIWGGSRNTGDILQDLHVLTPASSLSAGSYQWSQPSVHGYSPEAAFGATLCNFKGKLLVIGGSLDNEGKNTNRISALTLRERTWTTLQYSQDQGETDEKSKFLVFSTVGPLVATTMHAVAVSSNALFIFGGSGANNSWKNIYVLKERV